MRDYFSPAKRAVSEAVAKTGLLKFAKTKQQSFAAIGAASILVVSTVAFVAIRSTQLDGDNNNAITTEQKTESKTEPSTELSGTKEVETEGQAMTTSESSSSTNTEGDTKVIINNEDVPVPENGTIHRTIQNENGTTNVTVNVDAGSSTNQSTTTTNLNVSSSTYSRTESSSSSQ